MRMFVAVVVCFAAVLSYASPGDLHLLNGSSEPLSLPVRVSTDALPGINGSSALLPQPDGSAILVDIIGQTGFIQGTVAPFSSIPVSIDRPQPAPLLPLEQTDLGTEIKTDAGTVIFQPQGRLSLQSQGRIVSLAIPQETIRVVYQGAAFVRVENQAESGPVQYTIYKNGMIQVDGLKTLRAIDPDGVFIYRQSRGKELGISRPAQGNDLTYPEDWWAVCATPSDPMIALFPMRNSVCKGLAGSFETINNGSYMIAPVATMADLWSKRMQTYPSCLLVENTSGNFEGTLILDKNEHVEVMVQNRNRNTMPDTGGDLWTVANKDKKSLILAFSKSPETDAGTRLSVFNVNTQLSIDPNQLEETPARAQSGDTAGLAALGAMEKKSGNNQPAADKDKIKAEFFIEDWNSDGSLFRGGLFTGGFLSSDRYSKNGTDWSQAWDLNADGFCDVFELSAANFYFNFLHEKVSIFSIHINPATANARINTRSGYEYQNYASQFKKSCVPGRFYQGAALGFEEHFFVDIKPGEFAETFSNGASFFYYANGGGNVNRLTMGRLDGSRHLRDWDIELNPDSVNPDITDWVVKTWEDPWGHVLKLNSLSVPDKWDGALANESQYLQGWYDMATNRYATKTLDATFSPPGSRMGSSEGMYGGNLTTQERIEIDEDGGTYIFYYSPLMGGLHLKGADYGSYAIPSRTEDFFLDIYRYYHREAHLGNYKFTGTQPGIRWVERESKRLEGPVFLTYFDQNKDGYFDTYLYDQDNDGIYDKRLVYSEQDNHLLFHHHGKTAVWPQTLEFDEVLYLPENYDRVGELYRKGTHVPPMVIASSMGSSAIPKTLQVDPFFKEVTPPFYFSFDSEWETRVAANATHDNPLRNPWKDFRPEGLSRLGTMFSKNGLSQTAVHGEWNDDTLADVDVLVVSELAMTPSSKEIKALKQWVSNGGTVLFACPADEIQRMRFETVGNELGFSFSKEIVDKQAPIYRWASLGPINNPTTRAAIHRRPAPWNEIKHFSAPQHPDLLKNIEYASFVGYPLESTSSGFAPILKYEDHILLAQAKLGNGRILAGGAEIFNNRYIWHHEFFEDNVDTKILVERLIDVLCKDEPVLQVTTLDVTPERSLIEFFGKGGNLFFSRRYDPRATDLGRIGVSIDLPPQYDLGPVMIDGNETEREDAGVLHLIQVPPGKHTVEIKYITKNIEK